MPAFSFSFVFGANPDQPRCFFCRAPSRTVECESCPQGWCSQECAALARSAGHALLCKEKVANFKMPVPDAPENTPRSLSVRSLPAISDPLEAVRQMCTRGVPYDTCGGVYLSSCNERAVFMNAQPLLSLRFHNLQKGGTLSAATILAAKHDSMFDALYGALQCSAVLIDAIAPFEARAALFVSHADRVEVFTLSTQAELREKVLRLDWGKAATSVTVLDVQRLGPRHGRLGGATSTPPTVFGKGWLDEFSEKMKLGNAAPYRNLPYTAYTTESIVFPKRVSVRRVLEQIADTTDKAARIKLYTTLAYMLDSSTASIMRQLFDSEADFFLYACPLARAEELSQTHLGLGETVIPVCMDDPTPHMLAFPETYAQWKANAAALKEELGDGYAMVYDFLDSKGRYHHLMKHTSRDLAAKAQTIPEGMTAEYKRCVLQGKMDVCLVCQKQGRLMKCRRCKVARYCSVECQTAHWPVHKKTCEKR